MLQDVKKIVLSVSVMASVGVFALPTDDVKKIPKYCITPILEQNLFVNVKSDAEFLSQKQLGTLRPSYNKIFDYFNETYAHLSQELTDTQLHSDADDSKTLKYIKSCAQHHGTCSGYFTAQNLFHRDLYCAQKVVIFAQYLETERISAIPEKGPAKELAFDQLFKFISNIQNAYERHKNGTPIPDAYEFIAEVKVNEEFPDLLDGKLNPENKRLQFSAFFNAINRGDINLTSHEYVKKLNELKELSEQFSHRMGAVFLPSPQTVTYLYPEDSAYKRKDTAQDATRMAVNLNKPIQEGRIDQNLLDLFRSRQKSPYNLLHGYSRYLFIRGASANILRKLNQMDVATGNKIIQSPDIFAKFAENTTCLAKSYPFCHKSYDSFRAFKFKDLYSKIIRGIEPVVFANGTNSRRYIFNQGDIDKLNNIIAKINEFCWSIADPDKYRKDKIFVSINSAELDKRLNEFYGFPRIHHLMSVPAFSKMLIFSSDNRYHQCLSKGHVFGVLEYTKTAQKHVGTKNLIGVPQASYMPIAPIGLPRDIYVKPIVVDEEEKEKLEREAKKKNLPKPQFVYEQYLTKSQIEDIEKKFVEQIEDSINLAVSYVQISKDDTKGIKKALRHSVDHFFPSMIDYAIDRPSQAVGELLGEGLTNNELAIRRQERIQTILIAVGVTVALGPLGAGMALEAAAGVSTAAKFVISEGTKYTCAAIGLSLNAAAISYDLVYQYANKKNLILSATTNNISTRDFNEKYKSVTQKITLDWAMLGASLLLDSIFVAKTLASNFSLIYKITFNKAFRVDYFYRQTLLDQALYVANGSDAALLATPGVREVLGNALKVSDDEFTDFISAIKNKSGRDHFLKNPTWAQAAPKVTALNNAVEAGVIKTFFVKIRVNLANWWTTWFRNKIDELAKKYGHAYVVHLLKYEAWGLRVFLGSPVKLINNLNIAIEKKILTSNEAYKIVENLGPLELNPTTGFLVLKLSTKMIESIANFLTQVVTDDQMLRSEVEIVLNKGILSADEISRLSKSLNEGNFKITTIEDVSVLDDYLYHIKIEHGYREQISRTFSGADIKYSKRIAMMIENASYHMNMIRGFHAQRREAIRNIVEAYSKKSGKSVEQILEEYAVAQNSDLLNFDLHRALSLKESDQALIQFVLNNRKQAASRTQQWYVDFMYNEHMYATKSLVESMNTMLRLPSKFTLKGALKDLVRSNKSYSFPEALKRSIKITQNSIAARECKVPTSPVKGNANAVFVRFMDTISVNMSMYSYFKNHMHEVSADPAMMGIWLSRLAYDIYIPRLGNFLVAKSFITPGAGHWTRWRAFNTSLWGYELGVGASYETFDKLFWTGDAALEAEMREVIQREGKAKETLEALLNPNLYPEKNRKTMEKALNIFKQKMAALEKVWQHYVENQDASLDDVVLEELQQNFIKEGLIDHLTAPEDPLIQNEHVRAGMVAAMYYEDFEVNNKFTTQLPFGITLPHKHWPSIPLPNGEISLNTDIRIKTRDYTPVWFPHAGAERFLFETMYNAYASGHLSTIRGWAMNKFLCSGTMMHFPSAVKLPLALASYAIVYLATADFYNSHRINWIAK